MAAVLRRIWNIFAQMFVSSVVKILEVQIIIFK